MSRRKGNNSRRGPGIDWNRAALLHRGGPEEVTSPEPRPEPEPEQKVVVHNEFTRKITGFSPDALKLLLNSGFNALDERGFVPVTFIGVSKKPQKTIDYKQPSLLRSSDRRVVLSGLVDKKSVSEAGNGTSNIVQEGRPDLDGYNSPRRFNVVLGAALEDFDADAAVSELANSELELSPVDSINGSVVAPDLPLWEVEQLWNRPQPRYT